MTAPSLKRVLRRLALGAMMAFLPAAASASCEGENLLEQLRADNPGAYAKILADAAQIPNGKGNFWKIERPGSPVSYLFGTFHSPLVAPHVEPQVWRALDAARIALFEITTADADAHFHGQEETSATHDWQAKPLRKKLTEPERYALDLALAERGMVASEADFMRATLLYDLLSYPVCHQRLIWRDGAEILDNQVESRAIRRGIPVASLETVPQQDAALNKMPPEDVVRMLVGKSAFRFDEDDIFQAFLDLYAEGDSATSFALEIWLTNQINDGTPGKDLYTRFDRWVLEHRNRAWMPRIETETATGGAFIAVGAAHLAHDYGLVSLLRQRGFTVTRMDGR